MSKPRRHHFIPQMIQRGFANQKGQIHFWRRGFPLGEARLTHTKNLFVEADLYTFTLPDGTASFRLEEFFSGIEGVGSEFFKQILSISRSGKIPKLDKPAWEFFGIYTYYQMKRAPQVMNGAASAPEVQAVRARELRRLEEAGEEFNEAEMARDEKNAIIFAQASPPGEEVVALLGGLGMAIYRINSQKRSFILGDCVTASAILGGNGDYSWDGPVTIIPVAPDIAIGFLNEKRVVRVIDVGMDQVRRINESIAAKSTVIAGRSPELIASLSMAIAS